MSTTPKNKNSEKAFKNREEVNGVLNASIGVECLNRLEEGESVPKVLKDGMETLRKIHEKLCDERDPITGRK